MIDLLFNMFLCDLFPSLENKCFTNYADDTDPYVAGKNSEEEVSKLKELTQKKESQNEKKANLSKCHMLLSTT